MAGRCAKSTAIANPELQLVDERRPVIRKSRAGPRRAIVLLLVQAAIAVHVAHWMSTGRTLSPVEPSESMQFSKSGVVNAGLVFFALSIGSTLLFGRWFCGWGCHGVAQAPVSMRLTTGSFWETFPSLPVAVATFLVCGFAAVYLLGSKGFCTYG